MADVREFELPGVGVRYEFTSRSGVRISVVSHRSGRKEIFVGGTEDDDSSDSVAELDEDDSRTLAELLGGSKVTERLMELQQKVEGLAIDWLPLRMDSPAAGLSIGEARIRTKTGASVLAVLRGDHPTPAPGPEFRLEGGDYLVVVGTPRMIEAVVHLLHTG